MRYGKYKIMVLETIVAIATALSESGISIIRVSGSEAISIVDSIFVSNREDFHLTDAKTHTIHYGTICFDGKVYDEVLVSVMRGPNSYTREDVVEINCHGGVLVTKEILELVVSRGARIAEPGEFTKRAFLNGRIDLTKAEAVMNLIQSKNQFALENSVKQLRGSVTNKIKELRESILYENAFIESALDDPENYDLTGYEDKLSEKCDGLLSSMDYLLKNTEDGRLLQEGIKTCIIGKPNAGKSSFLNELIGKEKAIVTEIAGTTRDILEETVRFGDFTLQLIDTAGIHDTEDVIEKIGVERAKEYAKDADLIFYIIDSTYSLDEEDTEIMNLIQDKPCIVLLNKYDLQPILTPEDLAKIPQLSSAKMVCFSSKGDFVYPNGNASTKEEALDNMKQCVSDLLFHGGISFNDEVVITSMRQKENLKHAREAILQVKEGIAAGMSEDFLAMDLMRAYTELGLLIGEEVEDDLVEEIFSKFCMGK